jgi:hypothetical protein
LSERGSESEKLMNKKRRLVIMGIVAAAVLLLASSCSLDYRPIIHSLEAETPGWTAPSGSLQVTCNASDPDDVELSYSWSASEGNITGTGAVVNWTAPGEVGMYDLTVVVSDSQNVSATGSIALIASNGPPPTIESLIVTAQEPKYLRETTDGYMVAETKKYDIACNASGTGELVYEWSCADGEISGEGSNITWTAPDKILDRTTVTAKVFDGARNWVSKSIVFEVACTCTFG